jgi:hypothetical protein
MEMCDERIWISRSGSRHGDSCRPLLLVELAPFSFTEAGIAARLSSALATHIQGGTPREEADTPRLRHFWSFIRRRRDCHGYVFQREPRAPNRLVTTAASVRRSGRRKPADRA